MSELLMNLQQRKLQRTARRNEAVTSSFGSTTYSTVDQNVSIPGVVEEQLEEPNEDDDPYANILSLKLKKPKHWKWELSTSRSCSNIALPRILLYDHTGVLLVDADAPTEQIYRPTDDMERPIVSGRRRSEVTANTTSRKRSTKRSLTSNMSASLRQALDNEFNGLCIAEATPSPPPTPMPTKAATPADSSSSFSRRLSKNSPVASSCIDFYTNELPDYQFERRSSSLKGVRFKEDAGNDTSRTGSRNSMLHACSSDVFPTPPSTVTTTTTATATPTSRSSSSGPREKRRYRRSQSSGRSPVNSSSILERFSYHKGRFSSPEYAEEHEVQHGPRYYLRTSKAGTLIVQEESFSRYRQRRRRPKHSSSENILNDSSPRSQSTSSLQKHTQNVTALMANSSTHLQPINVSSPVLQGGSSLQNVNADTGRHDGKRVTKTVRRYRSDGNILQAKQLSTSEEDVLPTRHQTLHGHVAPGAMFAKEAARRDLVTVDPDNRVQRGNLGPTAR